MKIKFQRVYYRDGQLREETPFLNSVAIDFGMLLPRGGGGDVICSRAVVKALRSLITSPTRQSMSAARCSGKRSANFGKLKFGS